MSYLLVLVAPLIVLLVVTSRTFGVNQEYHDWTLYDLRRPKVAASRDLPAAWKRTIEGFDMVPVAPVITSSNLLGAR